MKKISVIFIGLMMTVPTLVHAENASVQYGALTTALTQGSAVVAANDPKYDLNTITTDDQGHIASTAYVKGAHNTALTAINYLSDNKQNVLDSGANGNVSVAFPTGYTANNSDAPVVKSISADGAGNVTVTKGEVVIPVTSATAPTAHAEIWLQ